MNKHIQLGFSLIEVAIVMVIIGFMLASLLGPLGNRMEQSKIEATSIKLDEIIEAIYGYTLINGFLPCPDNTGDGLEDRTGNDCDVTSGEPPWSTLGMGQLFDEWGQILVYRLDISFANSLPDGQTATIGACVPSTTASFSMCSAGNINVTNGLGGTPPNTVLATNVPAIVASIGKPKDPATTHADEIENGPIIAAGVSNDANFVSRDHRPETAPMPFNDIVRWIPTNVLIGKMVQAQRLP